MSIAVFAYSNFPLDEVVAALHRDGIDAFPVRLDSMSSPDTLASPIETCVLIIREQGDVSFDEQTGQVRDAIGHAPPSYSALLWLQRRTAGRYTKAALP